MEKRKDIIQKTLNFKFSFSRVFIACIIILILYFIFMISVSFRNRPSRNSFRRTNMNTIRATLEEYYVLNRNYPESPSDGSFITINQMPEEFKSILSDDINEPNSEISLENATNTNYGAYKYCYRSIENMSKYELFLRTEPEFKRDPTSCNATGEDFSLEID